MIEFHAVSKTYGDFTAVRMLALTVDKGEVFGFLGPNGAGKTTTIRMMMGILVPSDGRITIDGLDCQAERVQVKQRVGYLPDNPIFYDYLRGREILAFVGEMHGQSRDGAQRRTAAAARRARARGRGRGIRCELLGRHEEEARARLRADPRSGGAHPR